MERAFLTLKSGASHVCSLAEPGSLKMLLAGFANPAKTDTVILKLRLPHGEALDVLAGDVANIEVPAFFCTVRDFLTPREMNAILTHVLTYMDTFGDAAVSSPATQSASKPDYKIRNSHVSDHIAPLAPILVPRLQALMPRIWPHLHLAPIIFEKIEFELAYHGDGGFFKAHMDNALPDIAHRRVSCVYYFHREPRQFDGGQLRMFSTMIENGIRRCGTRFVDIEPQRNSLIVFPSDCYHEVMPIQCGSRDLVDQRLSLNIWLCS